MAKMGLDYVAMDLIRTLLLVDIVLMDERRDVVAHYVEGDLEDLRFLTDQA